MSKLQQATLLIIGVLVIAALTALMIPLWRWGLHCH